MTAAKDNDGSALIANRDYVAEWESFAFIQLESGLFKIKSM